MEQGLLRFLDALEVSHRFHTEFRGSILVADDARPWVQLQRGDGPHVAHAFLDAFVKGVRLVCACDDHQHLTSVHHSSHTYGQGHLWNRGYVVCEEPRVRQDRVIR